MCLLKKLKRLHRTFRMIEGYNQSIQWKHMHRTSKDLVCKREEIKFDSIIKQYKNGIMLKKYLKNIIQTGSKFLITHTK